MKANYGVDAPKVVRNLFLSGCVLFALSGFSFAIRSPLGFWITFLYLLSTAASLVFTGCWMLYGIRCAKPRMLRRLVQDLHLKGDERVLDLGCGRGALLIEAAKHLPSGKAYGIDLWQSKDQSGNTKETTLNNAALEGVNDRIEVHTGDFRSLPFADATFDVVVSSLAIHNVHDEKERERVLLEILRVLKQGGRFAVMDIFHTQNYERFLSHQSVSELQCSKKLYSYCPPIQIVSGQKADA